MKRIYFVCFTIIVILLINVAWLIDNYKVKREIEFNKIESFLFDTRVDWIKNTSTIKTSVNNYKPQKITSIDTIASISGSGIINQDVEVINENESSSMDILMGYYENYLQSGYDDTLFILNNNEFQEEKSYINNYYYSSYFNFPLVPITMQVALRVSPLKIIKSISSNIIFSIILFAAQIYALLYLSKLLKKQIDITNNKDKFINMMSHDFKTPLAVIKSSASQIENKCKSKNLDTDFVIHENEIISKEVYTLNNMIINILNMSKQKNRSLVEKDDFNIVDLIKEIIFRFHDDMVSFDFYSEKDEIIITTDKQSLMRVIVNVIHNAILYNENDPHIDISIKMLQDNHVSIAIKDNGIGIPSEYHEHVFDKFFRVNPMSAITGSGLGLSIAKEIMASLGGDIFIGSSSDNGTEMIIEI